MLYYSSWWVHSLFTRTIKTTAARKASNSPPIRVRRLALDNDFSTVRTDHCSLLYARSRSTAGRGSHHAIFLRRDGVYTTRRGHLYDGCGAIIAIPMLDKQACRVPCRHAKRATVLSNNRRPHPLGINPDLDTCTACMIIENLQNSFHHVQSAWPALVLRLFSDLAKREASN